MTSVATHPYSPEEMMAFCDGELSPAESQAVREHLTGCMECAEQVREFRETARTLAAWSLPPVSRRVEDAVEEQLRGEAPARKIRGSSKSKGFAGRHRWRPWVMGGASAMAAIVLVAGLLIVRRLQVTPDATARMDSYVSQPSEGLVGGQNATLYAKLESAKPNAPAASPMFADQPSSFGANKAAPAPPPSPQAPTGPLIARTVNFTIVAKDMNASRAALDAILARYRGYAAQMTVETPGDGSSSLQASLRVPVADLPAAMKDLRGLGRVASESESGEDVTQQHQDLDQRLITARYTEERFRAILQQHTGNVSDVLEVEEGIARVRGEIESMEAEQAALNHRVDFAQVDLSVSEEFAASVGSGSPPLATRLRNGFVEGYRNAAGTIVGIFLFLIQYGLTILIWIAILAVPVILLRRRYRRMRARV